MAFRHLLASVAVIALMAQPALAQDTQQPQAQGDQVQVAQEDQEFAKEAAQGGLMEVRLGELAQEQAKSAAVKDFGQRMVQDHGEANDKLKQIAEQKGIELPQDLSEDAQSTLEELQQQQGAEFDQAYMDEMVSDHEDDVAAFEGYIENAQDPDLRAFAEETLPTLQEHLEMAKQAQEQVAAAGEQEQPQPSMAADAPTGGQMAAEQPAEGQPGEGQPGEGEQGFVSLDEVLGSSVVNENGEEVGTIEDVVVKDQAHYAVLSVGGFLGIAEKDVAIPLDELKLGEDETYLMSTETEEQLEELPEYEAAQFEPAQR